MSTPLGRSRSTFPLAVPAPSTSSRPGTSSCRATPPRDNGPTPPQARNAAVASSPLGTVTFSPVPDPAPIRRAPLAAFSHATDRPSSSTPAARLLQPGVERIRQLCRTTSVARRPPFGHSESVDDRQCGHSGGAGVRPPSRQGLSQPQQANALPGKGANLDGHPVRAVRLVAGAHRWRRGTVAVVADFEVLEPWPRTVVEDGKFKTFPFNAGGRLVKRERPSDLEAPNALVTYVVSAPEDSGGVRIRTIVNDNPLPDLAFVAEGTERTVTASFPASLLARNDNQIELASVDQKPFTLSEVVCWFRQNS